MDAAIDTPDNRTVSTSELSRSWRRRETLGDRLRHARLRRGWSQRILAEWASTSSSVIQKIENGKSLRPRNIVTIAEALEVEPSWLMFGDGETAPHLSTEAIAVAKAWSKLPERERNAVRESVMRLSKRG
jgi:transcriptional regulator with XRE-family HTH domain